MDQPDRDEQRLHSVTLENARKRVQLRLHAEDVLSGGFAQFATVLDHLPTGVLLLDGSLHVQHVNAAARPAFGDPTGVVGSHFLDLSHRIWPPETAAELLNCIRTTLDSGEPSHAAGIAWLRPNGELKYYDWEMRRMTLPNGRSGIVATFTDTSRYILAKKALEENQRRVEAIFNQAAVGIATTYLDGHFENSNEKFCSILGYSQQELLSLTDADITHPDDLPQTHHGMAQLLAGRINDYSIEKRYLHRNGGIVWSFTTVTLLKDAVGRPLRYIGVIEDITLRKTAGENIRDWAERLQLALAAGNLGDWSWDAQTDLVTLGDRAAEIFSLPLGKPVAWSELRTYLEADDRARVKEAVERAVNHKTDYSIEYRLKTAAGPSRWVAAKGRCIYDEAGNVIGMTGVVQDISDRKHAVKAIEARERELSLIYNNVSDVIFYLDVEGASEFRFLSVNQAFFDTTGLAEDQVTGKRVEEVIPEPSCAIALENYRLAIREARTVRWEAETQFPSGLKVGAASVTPIFGHHGKCINLIGTVHDISERKRSEDARLRLAAVVESSDDAIVGKSLEGIITSWNKGAERMFGYKAEEIIGLPVATLIPIERHHEEPKILARLQKGERIDLYETVRVRKDGKRIDVALTVSPIVDATGRVIGVSKIARDITERKRTADALREEHIITEHLNRVAMALATELDLNTIVQIITDAGTRVTRAQFGAFFYSVTGEAGESYNLSSWSGIARAVADFPITDATKLFERHFRGERVIRIADVRNDPCFGQKPPYHGIPLGHLPIVSYLAVPVFARSGEVLGGLFFGHSEEAVFTDRDERITVGIAAQAAAALDTARIYRSERKARETAEQANQAKDHFIAALSHELRTPLTPALAILTSLLETPGVSGEFEKDLETARRNIELEARLIDDLLDLTRVARGKLELQCHPVPIHRIIEDAIETCIDEIKTKEISLVRDFVDPELTIHGDSSRLTQILWNLLKNAVKFTPEGGSIIVRTRVTKVDGDEQLTIQVQDNGIGIEPAHLERVFAAFEQGDRKVTRQFGGLGLGLAISKAIAEAHHGALRAQSPGIGKGSTFTLALPVQACDASEPHSDAPNDDADSEPHPESRKIVDALRILLVEDHTDTAAILARLLHRMGHEVLQANRTAHALAIAEAEMDACGIDLVISDLGLPDGSGLDMMRKLASKYHLRGIALSGFGMDSDRQQSLDAGFSYHLTKPIDVRDLRRIIDEMLVQK